LISWNPLYYSDTLCDLDKSNPNSSTDFVCSFICSVQYCPSLFLRFSPFICLFVCSFVCLSPQQKVGPPSFQDLVCSLVCPHKTKCVPTLGTPLEIYEKGQYILWEILFSSFLLPYKYYIVVSYCSELIDKPFFLYLSSLQKQIKLILLSSLYFLFYTCTG
jgi:hypothetical protein